MKVHRSVGLKIDIISELRQILTGQFLLES